MAKPKQKAKESTPTSTRWDAIKAEANYLAGLHLEYSNVRPPWPSGPGFDCSSSCAQLMKAAGYKVPFFSTATAPSYMIAGKDPSNRLTFWNNDISGTGGNSVHMFAELEGRQWGTGGNGNPGWNEHTTSGFKPWHIKGLDEAADLPKRPDTSLPGGQGEGGTGSYLDVATTSKAAAISAFLKFPGLLANKESEALKGQRSLMNDKPLLPFIEQLTQASLRNFMSMPNGNFYAFIPDYFGGLTGRSAYWEINDIEILDGAIHLSDDSLATHVYIVGDTNADQQINWIDKISTTGVVTVFDAFMADFMSGVNAPALQRNGRPDIPEDIQNRYDNELKAIPSLAQKDKAISFLQRYGARPYFEEAPMIRSHYFEMFLAYQIFCLLWSKQFEVEFELTFMPELFPGGIVQFPTYGIQCYIEEVTHVGDYTNGFTTMARLVAPSALPQNGRKNVQAGMIRSGLFDPEELGPHA